MPNRILKETIRTSKKLNQLSNFEFRLWVNLITYVDDFGRGDGNLDIIKGFVMPLRRDVTIKNIQDALTHMESIGLIDLYKVDGEPFLCFPNWSEHQRIQNKKSKYPAPYGDSRKSTVTHGEISSESNPIQYESNPNPNPNIYEAQPNPYRPDPDDVKDFIAVKGYHFSVDEFMEYYDAVDWKQHGEPIRNWMAKCSVFERNWKEKQGRQKNRNGQAAVKIPVPDYIRNQTKREDQIDFDSLPGGDDHDNKQSD